jgi:beta-glucosidase-like glycosyl hydrolase|eukprot:COSAG06_NODE_1407_length_9550_cov_1.910380_10_plen_59_part_00
MKKDGGVALNFFRSNQLNVNVSARSLHETYLPAMKACVARGKATHVMCSYLLRPTLMP